MITQFSEELAVQIEVGQGASATSVEIIVRPNTEGQFPPVVESFDLSAGKSKAQFKTAMANLEKKLSGKFTGSEGTDAYHRFVCVAQQLGFMTYLKPVEGQAVQL